MEPFYLLSSAAMAANLTSSEFVVLSYFARIAQNRSRSCQVAKAVIAKACGISLSTVYRAIQGLCKAGLLEVRRKRFRNNQQEANLYILIDEPQIKIAPKTPCKPFKIENEKLREKASKQARKAAQKKTALFKCDPNVSRMSLSPMELKVHTYLNMRSGKDDSCFPSKAEISRDCGISVSTAHRAIRCLSAKGLLRVEAQDRKELFGNNGAAANRYYLLPVPVQKISAYKSRWTQKVLLFFLFREHLTPSPLSPMTPFTNFKTRATLKQRKNRFTLTLRRSIPGAIAGFLHRLADSLHPELRPIDEKCASPPVFSLFSKHLFPLK